MVDDIYLSPEEQDERAKKWLKDNGLALAVGIGLGLAAVTGYNQYQDNLLAKAEQASALYSTALDQVRASELTDISAQVQQLKENYASTSYAAKAALLKAKQLAVSDLDAALVELQWVAENAPEESLQHTARIRQAKILLTQNNAEEAKALATPQLTAPGFSSHYQEILAEAAVQQGDYVAARSHYQQAIEALSASEAGYGQVLTIKLDRLPAATSAVSAE